LGGRGDPEQGELCEEKIFRKTRVRRGGGEKCLLQDFTDWLKKESTLKGKKRGKSKRAQEQTIINRKGALKRRGSSPYKPGKGDYSSSGGGRLQLNAMEGFSDIDR